MTDILALGSYTPAMENAVVSLQNLLPRLEARISAEDAKSTINALLVRTQRERITYATAELAKLAVARLTMTCPTVCC